MSKNSFVYLVTDTPINKKDGARFIGSTRQYVFSSYKKAFSYVVKSATGPNPRKIETETVEEVYKDAKGYQGGYFLLVDREDDRPTMEITISKKLVQ